MYQDFNPHLMICVLNREHPEIATLIKEKIKKTLPEDRLYDSEKISGVIGAFKRIRGDNVWLNRDLRDEMLAVVLLFYRPERLLGLQEGKISKLIIPLARELGVSRNVMSYHVRNAIVAFRVYDKLKKEVYKTYSEIVDEIKPFDK